MDLGARMNVLLNKQEGLVHSKQTKNTKMSAVTGFVIDKQHKQLNGTVGTFKIYIGS